MDQPEHADPLPAEEGPSADPAYVARLAALRPEPRADGDAPTDADLERILSVALTVPDHGDLTPWRFAVSTGPGRARFARALLEGLHELRGDGVPAAATAKMASKAYAAPCSVMVIASPDPSSNVEVWEQVASASCTGYALVLAATGLGYGAVWKSAGVLGTRPVRDLFGCTSDEVLLGWVNLGTAAPLGRKGLVGRGGDADLGAKVVRIDA